MATFLPSRLTLLFTPPSSTLGGPEVALGRKNLPYALVQIKNNSPYSYFVCPESLDLRQRRRRSSQMIAKTEADKAATPNQCSNVMPCPSRWF